MTTRDEPAGAPPAADEPKGLFYGHIFSEAELRRAMEIKGLDEEVAILRLKLHKHLDKHPEDHALMLRSIDAIVRAVSARYRMSSERTDKLAKNLTEVLDALLGQFGTFE